MGEEDTTEAGEDDFLHQRVCGIVFAEAGQSLLDTVFIIVFRLSLSLCLFYCFVHFVLSFLPPAVRLWSVNQETISA